MSDINYWINFQDYSIYELTLTTIGWVFWFSLYIILIRDGFKNKYIEMPWFCALTNISWEFSWGFIFHEHIDEIGHLFVYNYRSWAILDIAIVYLVIKHGKKQVDIPEIRKYFTPICIVSIIVMLLLYSSFIYSGFDHKFGSQSAYITNLVISIFYIHFFLKKWKYVKYSKWVGWFKCLGTFTYTIVFFNFDPENVFLHVLGFVVFFVDLIYLYLLHTRQNKDFKITPHEDFAPVSS